MCDALDDRGGAWGDDGNIIFAPGVNSLLFRVSSAGGQPEALTKFEKVDGDNIEVTHRWPRVLPGANAILFTSNTITGIYENASIVVQSLETGKRKILQHGGYDARYLPTGHIVYIHESTLFAVPFDLKRLDLIGQPVPVIEGVASYGNNGVAPIAFSSDGTVVYQSGSNIAANTSLYWMNPEGSTTPLYSTPGNY